MIKSLIYLNSSGPLSHGSESFEIGDFPTFSEIDNLILMYTPPFSV